MKTRPNHTVQQAICLNLIERKLSYLVSKPNCLQYFSNQNYLHFAETKDIEETFSRKEYCPFDGRYKVTYKSDNYNKTPCTKIESTMDSCPSGSTLNIRFPRCHQQTVGK